MVQKNVPQSGFQDSSQLGVQDNTASPSPQVQKNRKRIVAIGAVLALLIVGISTYLILVRNQKKNVSENVNRSSQTTKNKQSLGSNKLQSYLLDDLRNLRSDILVSDWEIQYAVYLRSREEPLDYSPFGLESGSISINEDMVVLNLESGQRKVHHFEKDYIPPETLDFLKEVTSEGGSHYRLHTKLLRWSPFTENVFWGKVSIYSNGDPPIANEVGLFKVDLKNSTIDTFTIPSHGLFGEVNENTNAGKVLYESIGNGLSLYEYNLETKEDKLIVSYSKEVFDAFCGGIAEYVYATPFYGDCGRERDLRADWEDEGVSYFDFVTKNKVVVETD